MGVRVRVRSESVVCAAISDARPRHGPNQLAACSASVPSGLPSRWAYLPDIRRAEKGRTSRIIIVDEARDRCRLKLRDTQVRHIDFRTHKLSVDYVPGNDATTSTGQRGGRRRNRRHLRKFNERRRCVGRSGLFASYRAAPTIAMLICQPRRHSLQSVRSYDVICGRGVACAKIEARDQREVDRAFTRSANKHKIV